MEFRFNTRIILWLAIALFAIFLAFQLVSPRLVNPPVTAELQAPPEVRRVLRNSCYNCHSNETQLLWYDRIAPASWLVASDVYTARKHLNFSEIGMLPGNQQKAALYEAVNMIQLGAMPLGSYTLLHPQARVAQEDLAVLKNYLLPPAPAPDEAAAAAADAQYRQWVQSGAAPSTIAPAPNGIDYIPAYKDWKVLSTTDRFDNKTLRVIFGNDVAMKAIAEHRTNPWPDGTVFAKTAWAQQPDANGDIKTGAFIQVEFMIKDARRYASTEGWGFARWRGTDLRPYGKTADFTNECTGCHAPVRRQDFVYSFPLEGQQ